MKKESETKVQFSIASDEQDQLIERKRAKGKEFAYEQFKYQWETFPKLHQVPPFPLNVDIESCSSCNLRCDHCFRQYMDMGKEGLMDYELYKKIVAECGKNKLFTLKFSMRGEPTLHPKIVDMVAYAKEQGVKEVWINTHGGNLTEKMARGFCEAKLDWLTVSFDGLGEMYESIRKPLKYHENLERLKMMSRMRTELHPDMILNVQSIWTAIQDNPQEYIDTMRPWVDRVAYNAEMNFKEITLVPDDDFVCPRLWQRLAICSNGDYLKCPSDFEKEEVMGNANTMTLKDAWDVLQGKQREMHARGYKKLSDVCQKCHHGCRKVPKTVEIDGRTSNSYNYVFKKEYTGAGLNRTKVKILGQNPA